MTSTDKVQWRLASKSGTLIKPITYRCRCSTSIKVSTWTSLYNINTHFTSPTLLQNMILWSVQWPHQLKTTTSQTSLISSQVLFCLLRQLLALCRGITITWCHGGENKSGTTAVQPVREQSQDGSWCRWNWRSINVCKKHCCSSVNLQNVESVKTLPEEFHWRLSDAHVQYNKFKH